MALRELGGHRADFGVATPMSQGLMIDPVGVRQPQSFRTALRRLALANIREIWTITEASMTDWLEVPLE